MRPFTTCLALVCALLSLPAQGRPPAEGIARARAAWLEGRQLFNQGRFEAAKGAFAAGYRLSGKEGFLFNMAECERLIGRKPSARRLYLRYLSEHPGGRYKGRALRRCQALRAGPCDAPQESSRRAGPVTVLSPDDPSARQPLVRTRPPRRRRSRPSSSAFYKHWGFWAGVGAVVVAGSVTAIVLGTRSDGAPPTPAGDYTLDLRGGR